MGAMTHNRSPISVRDGKVFIDGVEVMDGATCTITITTDTWTGRFLGDRTPSTRMLGYSVKGTITRGRTTAFLKDYRTPLKTSAANLHYAFYRHITQNFLEIRKYACENFRQSADKIPSTSLRHRFLEVPYIQKYRDTGIAPEFTVQGVSDDPGSDYQADSGKPLAVTVVGCVLTGDINLLDLNSDGDILKDTINFNAKDVIID